MIFPDDDDELEELRAEDRAQRARVAQFCRHPDWRDPEHPEDEE